MAIKVFEGNAEQSIEKLRNLSQGSRFLEKQDQHVFWENCGNLVSEAYKKAQMSNFTRESANPILHYGKTT